MMPTSFRATKVNDFRYRLARFRRRNNDKKSSVLAWYLKLIGKALGALRAGKSLLLLLD